MSLKKGLVLDLDISSEGLQGTTKFKDKTPYENNGTLSNVTLTTDHKGKANNAGLFNGTDSYIDCGNFQHLPLFTLSAWIKAGEDVTTYRTIFDKTDGLSSRNYWLSIDASTGILTLRFSVDGAAKVFYAKKINDNLWHHIVVTYDNSYVRFYIDGVIYSSGEQTGLPGNASSNLYVGYQRVDPTRKFYGSIERPQIWNRALSADEVKLLYESYNPCLKMTRALKGTFVDSRDGTEYKTIKIGNQTWMAENLKYLPSVSPSNVGSETDPFYYVYDYQGTDILAAKATDNYKTYGVLYNWEAAKASCPKGWHLPSDTEYKILEMYLGMTQAQVDAEGWRGTDEGGKLKEAGTTHWISPNTGATNSSGFTALPAGYRVTNGSFSNLGSGTYFWSSSASSSSNAWRRYLGASYSTVYRGNSNKAYGFSVRCIRDY